MEGEDIGKQGTPNLCNFIDEIGKQLEQIVTLVILQYCQVFINRQNKFK